MYLDDGELFLANKTENTKSKKPLVFFVHFLGGHKKVLKRHVELVNDLGFDAYVFNLKDSHKEYNYFPLSSVSKKFGLKHVMADQIENHLNQFDDYKEKIVFAFSNISGSAIECLSRRFKDHKKDVIALICDSGPGLEFFKSSYNLLKHQIKVQSVLARMTLSPVIAFGWSLNLNKDVSQDLKSLPDGFPVLSIRGWRDILISPKSIDDIFNQQKHLRLHKVDLPEAGHINGLRDFPTEYIPPVKFFIQQL